MADFDDTRKDPKQAISFQAAYPLALILMGLYLTSNYSFMLFHSLAKGFSIAACVGVFMIGWHCRRFLENGYLSFIGIAYLFLACLEMLHTLSFPGTGIFAGYGPDLPARFWVAGRYLQSLSLLVAPVFLERRLRYNLAIAAFAVATGVAVMAIFGEGSFPVSYREGLGLTPFMRGSEVFVSFVFLCAGLVLYTERDRFDPLVLRWLLMSIAFSVISVLFYPHHAAERKPFDLLGHFSEIIAFYLAYKAVIETGLVKPYNLLFRNLKRNEEELLSDNAQLVALQQQLAEKNDELQRLNGQKNSFLGVVAHDLRSPLSAILWYSEFLLEGGAKCLETQQKEYLVRMRKSTDFMLSLVDDLLDITKIEAGKLTLEPRSTDLAGLVEDNVAFNRTMAEHKNIHLHFKREGTARQVLVDPARIEQALNNLISNAVKYSRQGSNVWVQLGWRELDLLISVRDEGLGIPEGERGQLFNAFSRTSVKSTAGEKSTGLGLAIVKKIVEEHGGRIWLESQVGVGTTFFISLPADGMGARPA